MADPLTRLHFVLRGGVQGIGYRWFVRERAEELGLGGWVLNREDGAVEGEAEGAALALERFVKKLKSGHPYARVEEIETKSVAATGEKSFEIR